MKAPEHRRWDRLVGAGARVAAALCAALISASIAAAPPSTLHGVPLADYVHIEAWDSHLRLLGATVVDRNYLPFQVVALYVGRDAVDANALADGRVRCRVQIHWLGPALDATLSEAWWLESFRAAQSDAGDWQRVAETLQRVAHRMGAVRRGSQHTIDYDPDAGLIVSADGKVVGRFAGLAVARAVLGVWLRPEGGRARAELLGTPSAALQ